MLGGFSTRAIGRYGQKRPVLLLEDINKKVVMAMIGELLTIGCENSWLANAAFFWPLQSIFSCIVAAWILKETGSFRGYMDPWMKVFKLRKQKAEIDRLLKQISELNDDQFFVTKKFRRPAQIVSWYEELI